MRTMLALLLASLIVTTAGAAKADVSPTEAQRAKADAGLAEAHSAKADASPAEAPRAKADASPAEAPRAKADELWREARVRPQDPRLIELLRSGMARSTTLRALVNRLEAGNVIVYISLSQSLRSSLIGKLTWMTKAGNFRYLKATINADQGADQMIATLAHELQHAIEVSDDAEVTDQRSLLALYKRIGRPSHSGLAPGWETKAAQDAGLQVRRELVSAVANAVTF